MKVLGFYFSHEKLSERKHKPMVDGQGKLVGYVRCERLGDFKDLATALEFMRPEDGETVLNCVPEERPTG